MLPSEELLGDDRGQATKHMPTGVDNDRLRKEVLLSSELRGKKAAVRSTLS